MSQSPHPGNRPQPAPPVYCCIPLEFIQPWEQADAIRAVAEHRLGNMVLMSHTAHVGGDADRQQWKERYPHLAAKIDAVPRFPERPKLGMAALLDISLEFRLEQLRLCRELGLKVLCFFPQLHQLPLEDSLQFAQAGKGLVLSEMIMGENLSILGSTLSLERLKQMHASAATDHVTSRLSEPGAAVPSIFDRPEELDFAVLQQWFIERFRAVAATARKSWDGVLAGVEASPQIRLALAAGVELPLLELVPTEPIRGIAATRGAARAYGKDAWGVHAAMGYFRPPADDWLPRRLAIAYHLFFAAGASVFTECNMPLRITGSCVGFFSVRATPPQRLGEEEQLGFDHPLCQAARDVVADHYRFTQFHSRPCAHPRVPMGYLTGHLDTGTERMWFVDQPGFLAADAARTWKHFYNSYDSEAWYTPPRKYYWQADPGKTLRYGTPPCGQVDIVPIEAPPEVLQSYGALALLGWNTMTAEHYRNLVDFVRQGGILFLSIPHLSTQTRSDQPQRFIHDGDVRALCGVRIVGPGKAIEEVLFDGQAGDPRCVMPQGTLYLEATQLAEVELSGGRPIAVSRDTANPGLPVVIEHRLGQGSVFLLNSWTYPGERLDAVITDILRTLADSQQGDIAIRSRDIHYALYDGVFPSGAAFTSAYLVNHDLYGQSVYPALLLRQTREIPLRVAGGQMRLAWIIGDLVLAPHDRYVKVTDARRQGDAWTLTLAALAPAPHAPADAPRRLQLATAGRAIAAITLDGQALPLEYSREGEIHVSCALAGSAHLTIRLAPQS